ncbi:hypothetical protein PAMC26577_31190 [Caballeronia sordidicola]|uniref:Uncharacterized protein n=1 Tax=Caballeronia sordidicola TaxID=196367 RepID=A0A242MED9_CABSO|nr:hypothetical protein PAMC26577_31190 [Caballeronia sordidicola]
MNQNARMLRCIVSDRTEEPDEQAATMLHGIGDMASRFAPRLPLAPAKT